MSISLFRDILMRVIVRISKIIPHAIHFMEFRPFCVLLYDPTIKIMMRREFMRGRNVMIYRLCASTRYDILRSSLSRDFLARSNNSHCVFSWGFVVFFTYFFIKSVTSYENDSNFKVDSAILFEFMSCL